MFNITVKDVLVATGGTLLCGSEDVELKDVCIDSREIKEGDLFIPIIGEKVDAHIYIEKIINEAAATLTSEHDAMESDKPYIKVNDTVKALQDIASYIRKRFEIPFVGVTGSVGKTTTREMVASALSQCLNTFQTIKNYNSQVGVGISIARMPEDTEVSVLEMGMSDFGQMNILSDIVKPHYAIVTMIGVAHLEYLKTRENIRKEKLAITNHMDKDGVLFLNGDDEMLAEMRGKMEVETCFYGTKEWCDYRAENIRMENFQYCYDFVHEDIRIPVVLNALGKHNVGNSLAALAVAHKMKLDLEKVAKGFETFQGSRQKLLHLPDSYTIIDDTYNASPDSMRASIDVLASLECQGKKLAVLADMKELGKDEKQFHYDLGKYISNKEIDELIVVGELAQEIRRAVEESDSKIACKTFLDNGEVELYLLNVMSKDDIVLLKGSNSMKLGEIVSNLMK